jgi:hypothetical protein
MKSQNNNTKDVRIKQPKHKSQEPFILLDTSKIVSTKEYFKTFNQNPLNSPKPIASSPDKDALNRRAKFTLNRRMGSN